MISLNQINMIDRAISKVQSDGYTKDKGCKLTVGLVSIIIEHEDESVNAFAYAEWEYME